MKRIMIPVLPLLVSAVMMMPSDGLAQQALSPFIGAGLAVGTGDLGEDTLNGWTLFGGVQVPIAVPGLSAGVTASYAHIPFRGNFDEAMDVTTILAQTEYVLLAEFPGSVKPYLRGGVGFQVQRYDPGEIVANSSTLTRPALGAGGGLHLLLEAVKLSVGLGLLTTTDGGFVGVHGGISLR